MAERTASSGVAAFRRYMEKKGTWILLLFGLLGAYVLLVPSVSLVPSLSPYNEKRALQVGLLLLVGGKLLASASVRQEWLSVFRGLPRGARWGLFAVLALGLLSSGRAPAPFYAFLEVGHFVLLFAAAGVVAAAVRKSLEWIEWGLLGFVVLGVLLYTAYFAVGYGMHLFRPDIALWPDGSTNFANIRHFNQYQTWTLPLLAVPVLALPNRRQMLKGGLFGLLAVWWMLVLSSNVRGTVLAVIVATVGVGLLFRRKAWTWIGIQVAALFAGLGLYYVLMAPETGGAAGGVPPVVDKMDSTGGYRGRIEHWLICLDMVRTHPVLGAGPMHYAWPPINFMPAAHPHNALMQWVGEWGLPSTVLMLGLTCWGGWAWMQHEREAAQEDDGAATALRVGLVATLLAGAAHSMVSGIIVMPVSQVFLVLVGGWAWGRYQSQKPSTPAHSSGSIPGQVVLCGVLVASMAIVGSSFRDLAAAKERQSAFSTAVERGYYSPRYWTQGYIGVRDSSVIERARRNR